MWLVFLLIGIALGYYLSEKTRRDRYVAEEMRKQGWVKIGKHWHNVGTEG